jgi:hypothetical protein
MSTLSEASTFFKHSALLGFIVWYSPAQLFFGDWNNLWHLLNMISTQ